MRLTHAEYLAFEARRKSGKVDSAGEGCEDESSLHEQIAADCKRRGWYYVHSRMDRATTQQTGVPDFLIFANHGKTFQVECKTAKGKLTREQAGTIHWLESLGHAPAVVRSIDEFLKLVNNAPHELPHPGE